MMADMGCGFTPAFSGQFNPIEAKEAKSELAGRGKPLSYAVRLPGDKSSAVALTSNATAILRFPADVSVDENLGIFVPSISLANIKKAQNPLCKPAGSSCRPN